MSDPRRRDVPRPEPARRDVLRLFGLTAAGVALGAYRAPAMTSFRPPAAFVGSATVTFFPEFHRTIACDGPASTKIAGALFSVNSGTFEGTVAFTLEPAAPTSGWVIAIDHPEVQLEPGDQAFVRVTLDCYSDPQVGAEPKDLKVRVTAVAHPADGSPAFKVGTLVAQGISVSSSLAVAAPPGTVQGALGLPVTSNVVVEGEFIDSSKFGPVLIDASADVEGVVVALSTTQLAFNGHGSFPVQVRVTPPAAMREHVVTVTVTARLDHASFAAPMVAAGSFVIQVKG